LGVPLLANPQTAVLYPLHWPLSWLPVTKQIYWSAALHTWLLGYGGYLLMRRWQHSHIAGLTTGVVLAGSGFYGGLIGHINQMNAAAWLPWAALILEYIRVQRFDSSQHGFLREFLSIHIRTAFANLRIAVLFALLVAIMFFAGHTQTLYINLFGLGLWAVWPRLMVGQPVGRNLLDIWTRWLASLFTYFAGVGLAGVLVAAQLLPTLELSDLGLRSGGMSYAEATSFSLEPELLQWTLFPTYGNTDLSVVFSTLGYSEFIAYVGLIAMTLVILALAGTIIAATGRATTSGDAKNSTIPASLAMQFTLLFVIIGFTLALGRWNPFYLLLYNFVPGIDLFRTPARWMMLYTMGMAVGAGVGIQFLWSLCRNISTRLNIHALLPSLMLIAIGGELLLAAVSLPHTDTTATHAVYGVRTAPAHLLTDPIRTEIHPAAGGRFLSMSTITFDPGDMGDSKRIFLESEPRQLDEKAFLKLIVAQKSQEILAPNLSLFWRIPAVDGFDGGVLPLQRYIQFLRLFINEDQLVPDGRLREQVKEILPAHLLDLLNAQYIITDKVHDFWFEHVYYDRQLGITVNRENPIEQIDAPIVFKTTDIGLLAFIEASAETLALMNNTTHDVATIDVMRGETMVEQFTLTAGGVAGPHLAHHMADRVLDSAMATQSGATVAYRDVEGQRQEYALRLDIGISGNTTTPTHLVVKSIASDNLPDVSVTIRATTFIDVRTGTFTPLLPSSGSRFQVVHGGDVKIYENVEMLPRAYFVDAVQNVQTIDEALTLLADDAWRPAQTAIAEGLESHVYGATDSQVRLVDYQPEQITLQTSNSEDGFLVLSDSYYPGWVATVDGDETPIYATNAVFRGIEVPAGEHTVVYTYRPPAWQWGMLISGLGLFACVGLWWLGRRRTISN
ncbi:MAG: YfhO family protein, partial [Chloroflexota bacterium]